MDLLKKICLTPSPSSDENLLVDLLASYKFKNFQLIRSKTNSISFSNKVRDKGLPNVMIDAHLDQVHLRILKFNTEKNTVLAQPVGFRAGLVRGTVVQHFNSSHLGIVHRIAPHFKKEIPVERQTVHIEFGLSHKESKETFIPGDSIVFKPHFHQIGQYLVGSSGLDNKTNVFILLSLLAYFDEHIEELGCNLIAHFSAREEIGMGNFGHYLRQDFDYIIVLDSIPTTDQFDYDEQQFSIIQQNGGAVITRDFEDHRWLGGQFIQIAQQLNLPHQISFSNNIGSSNSKTYSRLYHAKVQSISVPVDNMHSYTETADIRDLNAVFILMRGFLQTIDQEE